MSEMNVLHPVPENLSLSFSGKKDRRAPADNSENDPELQEQIRSEIEALVRIFLPEEADSIDGMLEEFRGREDQLLKSLRRMQAGQKHSTNGTKSSAPIDPDDFMMSESESENELERELMESLDFFEHWQRDLDQQLDDSSRSSHNSNPSSNPQQGTGEALLKTPPELLMNGNGNNGGVNNYVREEKKNDTPNGYNMSAYEDENDVPPDEELPNEVQTNSMRNLKVSNLTTDQSSINSDHSGSGSRSTLATLPSGKKTVALVKLRVWDPAQPKGRLKILTATHIILPDQSEIDEAIHYKAMAEESRKAGLIREESENSRSRKKVKRLSVVKEEPERPDGRGGSYFDEGNSGHEGVLEQAMRLAAMEVDADENDAPPTEGMSDHFDASRAKLLVGTLVGIQLKTSQSTSQKGNTATSIASNYSISSTMSLKQKKLSQMEWKIGKSINIHSVNLLPATNLSELHYRMESNHSSLRELVLDGLPSGSFAMEEYELIFEALGANTSIKRLSMRYSAVDDDIASLFALALVDNATMTQLSLEGNDMTTVSAKNFYSVLKKNNDTLRLLDLNKNPLIDEDVEKALDQFMEQRALKRTLTNKAEKAKRAARGMPPDATLDEDDDDCDGQVTVVCPQSIIDEALGGDAYDDENNVNTQPPEIFASDSTSESSSAKPYPGEDFRDFMLRMDSVKESKDQNPMYQQGLMDNSVRERKSFDAFAAEPQNPQVTGVDFGNDDSLGSSLTSRSTKKGGAENEIITMSPDDKKPKASTIPASVLKPTKKSRARPPPDRMHSIETQESADATMKSPGGFEDDFHRSSDLGISQRTMQTEASATASPGPHPYHNTNTSKGSDPELDISNNDYIDDKAGERAMRHQLAISGGAIGAYHIDEAAPARQTRNSGMNRPGQSGGGRARMGRSESQRQARLAQLQGGGSAPDSAPNSAAADSGNDILLDADIELAEDELFRENLQRSKSAFSVIGLDGEDSRTDRMVCCVLGLLLVGLLVMVILLMIQR